MVDINPQFGEEKKSSKVRPAGSAFGGDIPTSPSQIDQLNMRRTDGTQRVDTNRKFTIERPDRTVSRRRARTENVEVTNVNRSRQIVQNVQVEEDSSVVRRSRGYQQDNRPVQTELKYRIGMTASLLLAATALFFDIGELIISIFSGGFASYIKDFASIFLFPFLFWAFGIPFWKGNKRIQKLITMVTAFLISLVPILSDIMPELFVSVVVTLMYTRMEDRIHHKLKGIKRAESITRSKRN